jgi:hypothetical protein
MCRIIIQIRTLSIVFYKLANAIDYAFDCYWQYCEFNLPPEAFCPANNAAWDICSAGTEESARIQITAGQLGWADFIVVMESWIRA